MKLNEYPAAITVGVELQLVVVKWEVKRFG
jgi:hypothetical protein